MDEILTLSIEGMHCDACVRRVTKALEQVPGVQVETVTVGSARVKFTADHAAPAEIATAVDRIGFSVRIEK